MGCRDGDEEDEGQTTMRKTDFRRQNINNVDVYLDNKLHQQFINITASSAIDFADNVPFRPT